MVWELAAASLGTSVLGGVFGSKGKRRARRRQEGYIREARGLYGQGRGALDSAEGRALAELDDANSLLADLPEEILAGFDSQLRIRIGQQMRQEQQQQAQMQQMVANSGLDASTAGAGMQRGLRYGQAQNMGALSASMAGQRASAYAGAVGAHAQGLSNKANMIGQFGQARMNSFNQEAGFVGGIQVAPDQTGAAIGQLGGSLVNSLYQGQILNILRNQNSGFDNPHPPIR